MPKQLDFKHPLRLIREAISKEFKISQETLASMVGCSKTSIQQIESGKLNLSWSMAYRIDGRLGSSLVKWLDQGGDIEVFDLSGDKMRRNFKIIRDHHSKLNHLDELDYQCVEGAPKLNRRYSKLDFGDVDKPDLKFQNAWRAAVDRMHEPFLDELIKHGFPEADAKRLADEFPKLMEIYDFCHSEKIALHDLLELAVSRSLLSQVSWDFYDWAERANLKFKLGLENRLFGFPDVGDAEKHFGLLDIVASWSDEKLLEHDIRRITKDQLTREEIESYEVKPHTVQGPVIGPGAPYGKPDFKAVWFEGLDAN